eukprot:c47021_g1_i1 orf=358-1353(-)
MDSDDIHLLIWGLFGAIGCLSFIFFLVFFQHKLMKTTENHDKYNLESSSIRITLQSATDHSSMILPLTRNYFSVAQLKTATSNLLLSTLIKSGHSGHLCKDKRSEGQKLAVINIIEQSTIDHNLFHGEVEVRWTALDQLCLLPLCWQRLEVDKISTEFQNFPYADLATALGASRTLKASKQEKSFHVLSRITRLKFSTFTAPVAHLYHDYGPRFLHRNAQSRSIPGAGSFDIKLRCLSQVQALPGQKVSACDIHSFGAVLLDVGASMRSCGAICESTALQPYELQLLSFHRGDDLSFNPAIREHGEESHVCEYIPRRIYAMEASGEASVPE